MILTVHIGFITAMCGFFKNILFIFYLGYSSPPQQIPGLLVHTVHV